MIRFAYQHTLEPPELHRHFVRAGARPSLYSYRPRLDQWTLTTSDKEEALVIRQVLERLGVEFEEQVVTSRFAE